MQLLKTVLAHHSLDEFFEKFFNRLPLAVAGSAHHLRDYLNWQVVQEILEQKKSVLRIVKNGQMIRDHALVSFPEAKKDYLAGHTLVIKNSERSHPQLKNLADEFAAFFSAAIDIQVFISPKNTIGFGWHYDVEDVFIFQTQGCKHFTLRQNTLHPAPTLESLPQDLAFEKEQSTLYVNVTLKEGDWLYIPAGWWHQAHTTDEESMHISLGVLSKTALNILPLLIKELAQNSSWRTRLPLYKEFTSLDAEIEFYQEGMEGLAKILVAKMSNPQVIKDLLSALRPI